MDEQDHKTDLSPGSSTVRGFPIAILLLDDVTKFICGLCCLILKEPVQSPCGHRFCRGCLENVTPGVTKCDRCVNEGDNYLLSPVHVIPDRAVMREMDPLPARCDNHTCTWTGNFRDYLSHLSSGCAYRSYLDSQLDDVTCPFGCSSTGPDHQVSAAPAHCAKLLQKIRNLEEIISNHGNYGNYGNQEINRRLDAAEVDVKNLDVKLKKITATGDMNTESLAGSTEKLDMLEGIVAVLNREIEDVINGSTELHHQVSLSVGVLEGLREKMAALERTALLRDVTLMEMETRLKKLEMTSYTGTLFWRIDDVTRRRQEAARGQTPSYYSQPFYTGTSGYKMCARIYLFGDGAGRGSHVSLFFVVMRGDYDAILDWPFPLKVTLMLLDQGPSKDHVVESFRPDPNSSSFRRPQSDMNIASGVPLFCPHSRLEDPRFAYVRDDVMFIKVKVHNQ